MCFSATLPNMRRSSSDKNKNVLRGWKEQERITGDVAEEVEVATTIKEIITTMVKIKRNPRQRQKC